MKKITSFIVALLMLLSFSTVVFAEPVRKNQETITIEITNEMLDEAKRASKEGERYIIPLGRVQIPVVSEDGSIRIKETDFTVELNANHAGHQDEWDVLLHWKGDYAISTFKATSCKITSPDVLNWDSNGKLHPHHTTTSGYASLGVATIPNEVDGVRINMVNPVVYISGSGSLAIDFPPYYYPFH